MSRVMSSFDAAETVLTEETVGGMFAKTATSAATFQHGC
jgi:hypothetical protein